MHCSNCKHEMGIFENICENCGVSLLDGETTMREINKISDVIKALRDDIGLTGDQLEKAEEVAEKWGIVQLKEGIKIGKRVG